MASSIGIVRIDDDGNVRSRERGEIGHLGDVPAGGRQHRGILIVGRRQDPRPPLERQMRQQLNGGLRTAHRHHRCVGAVGLPRGGVQRFKIGSRRQRAPVPRLDIDQGIRHPIDPGRQVDPVVRGAAEALLGDIKIPAVLPHASPLHASARATNAAANSTMV
ncbi:hypothetical protein BLN97_30755 [Bradyrhizobium elkanii]|nr:hypothetical protein BLN97_30755 [Bradyrhizobium elkanii]